MTDADDLPDGWAVATLKDVATSRLGKMLDAARRDRGTQLPYLRNINVRWQHFELSDLFTMGFEEGELQEYGLIPGDVLICEGGEPGRAAVWQESKSNIKFQKAVHRVRLKGGILPEWLVLQLKHDADSGHLEEHFSGTTIKHFTGVSLAQYPLTLPPLAEQRRIVAKIEELTARSRAARAALAEVPTLLEQFRQSVLASAFRGDLTSDWRAKNPTAEPASVLLDRIRAERRKQWETKYPKKKYVAPEPVDDSDLPELPEGWEYARADEIVATGTVITYGIVLPGDPVDGGVPYVRGQDIEDGRILVEQLARTTPEIAARHDRSSLQQGDVLLCIIRHLKVAIVPAGIDGANLTQGTVRLRPSEVILGPYLAGYLVGPTAQAWMKERYFGMAMPRINVEDARAIPIPIAPIEEQREIIRQIDASERRRATALAEVTQALDESGGLDQSILAKAFRGELVPQDPADEPASDLLERIRQQQDSGTTGTTSTPKRRRTTSK